MKINWKMTRVRQMALGFSGLTVVVVAAAVTYVLLTDSKELRYPTQSALRGALGTTAAAELSSRGIELKGKLTCKDLPDRSKAKLRAGCRGTTSDNKPVQVIGTGENETDRHHFTILVGGRPLVENAACLGPDCRQKAG